MAKADIWMPLFIGDYLADTTRLTTVQHGAYMLLIMDYWRNGAPPDDDQILCNITKMQAKEWKKNRSAIIVFFDIEDGVLRHKRIESELSSSRGNKTKAAAQSLARWGDGDSDDRGRNLRSKRLSEARSKGTHTSPEWEHVKQFHNHCCVRCGNEGETVKDHITPIYQGGSDSIENLQPLCRKCNASKGPEAIDFRKTGWYDAFKNASYEGIKCQQNASPLPSPLPLKTLKSKAESALASRLPADWMPSVNDEDFLREERPDLLVDATARRFRDYWIAQPGVKGRKVDWPATWRNWVRNERTQVKQQGKSDKFDPTAYVNRNAPRAPT
jgi:uncharacterized protein YdaU (DUF1376 family)